MASPMRKKRAWSTPEDDAESRESAAFEASVAAAKDTAAKSGAFLSSAKEDLTDHQRWLRTQSAAVEKDRLRHERWLQRQHDQESAVLRKERISRRRRLMRQRAVQAVEQAALDLALFIRSWIAFAFGKIGDGFKFVGLSIGRGFAFVGQTIAMSLRWTGAKFGIAVREAGKGLSAGSSAVAAEAGKLSQGAGRSIGGRLSTARTTARTKGAGIASITGRASRQRRCDPCSESVRRRCRCQAKLFQHVRLDQIAGGRDLPGALCAGRQVWSQRAGLHARPGPGG